MKKFLFSILVSCMVLAPSISALAATSSSVKLTSIKRGWKKRKMLDQDIFGLTFF